MNTFFFELEISAEQIEYANNLVDYSIENHPVLDIFANDPNGKERQREYRFTGSLGEVVFADTYRLPRPKRAFGAIGGQDFGQDFVLRVNGKEIVFDVKTMGRKHNQFRENYVLNLPKYQMDKNNKTDCYFCISIHSENKKMIASFIGFVEKCKIENNLIGILYEKGTKRIKDDSDSFVFQRDTYEVDFKDLSDPFVSPRIKNMDGYKEKKILPPIN